MRNEWVRHATGVTLRLLSGYKTWPVVEFFEHLVYSYNLTNFFYLFI